MLGLLLGFMRKVSDRRQAARGLVFILVSALLPLGLVVLDPSHARADDPRSSYLIKLLQSSSQFRVRAQAAISLGAVEGSTSAVSALAQALHDPHPAVRAAAANSLGRIGDKSVVSSLRTLERDPEEPVRAAAKTAISKLETTTATRSTEPSPTPVPAGPALYYVAIAEPATRVQNLDRKSLSQARAYIKQKVAELQGVLIAPDDEVPDEAKRVLKRQSLKGFFLDSAIMSVEKKPDGATRVAVSVIVATYPGRDMRAIMQGAATVSGGGNQDYGQALQGALSGALRQLPQAMSR